MDLPIVVTVKLEKYVYISHNRDAWKSYEDWDKRQAKLGYICVVRKLSGNPVSDGDKASVQGFGKSTSTPQETEG